jgi:hypothetical protein
MRTAVTPQSPMIPKITSFAEAEVIGQLTTAGLTRTGRVVVEKPFGQDNLVACDSCWHGPWVAS